MFVLVIMEVGVGMNEDGWDLFGFMFKLQYLFQGIICVVCNIGYGLMGGFIMMVGVYFYVRIMGN